ncbi:hypothetical protein MAE02_40830 [Microvirga aerophila]|uniref:Uncharacterized protein n=1 Tax=Microvirga aerophila TaxID=670291 RepID=A0A512BX06_9HYPH|nr:hypothetical protein MAE02_40830 [Microvirga aerophila]
MDGTFSRSDFSHNPEADTYTCPEGKTLTTSGRIVNEGATRIYRGIGSVRNTPMRSFGSVRSRVGLRLRRTCTP